MMLPTTFNQTPYKMGNLKPKQVMFLQHLYNAGHTTDGDVVFKRNYLKTVANLNGISWAPAWIVKDVSRVTDRGMYAVPELNEYIAGVSEPTDTIEDVHEVSDDMGNHTVSDDVAMSI